MRSWLAKALAEAGVPSDTSCANFVLARFADSARGACLRRLALQARRDHRAPGRRLRAVPNCLRITIGDEASCRRVAQCRRRRFKARLPQA